MNINIDLSKIKEVINKKFFKYLTNKTRYEIHYGGAGSGKSVFIAQKILLRILVGFKTNVRHKFLCVRKTGPAIRKSVYALFKGLISEWNVNDIVKINKTDLSFTFHNGSEILCQGLDDREKIKSIYNITGIWCEEANELVKDDFIQLDLRLRGQTQSYKQIMCSFNPISKLIFLHDMFFLNPKEDSITIHSTYKDNRFLDAEYVRTLENLKDEDPTYYQIYTEGVWGVLKDIIYSNYATINEFPKLREVCYGLDFGYNSPSALIMVGEKDHNYFLEELLYQTKLTNDDLIAHLKRLIPKKYRRKRIIYGDTAEPARIEEINRAGFICKPSDKSIKDGIDYVKRSKLLIEKNSTNILKEISGYKYKEDKDGNVLELPLSWNDHLMDSMRYALYTHFGKIRPKASISFV